VNLDQVLETLDEKVINRLGISRAKNKVLGTGYIAGLKALVKVLNIPKPTVLTGKDSSIKMCESVASFGLKRTLIVTDRMLYELGVLDKVLAKLEQLGCAYELFCDVEPDPTFTVVEAGLRQYRAKNCDSVMAIGGGSSIDSAKVIALAASNQVSPDKLVGILKGKQASAPFFCIPTTAGTGSEVTIGAVISDTDTHQKELVIDTRIVPLMAALDPELMKGLPAPITAATGMDALTHLVESFLSTMANEESMYYSKAGIKLVFDNLQKACKNGKSTAARENMALASFYGGLTINISGLGYVHAFAHQIGARYKLPHGLANAKVLPHILHFNKKVCEDKLAQLADLIGVAGRGTSNSVKAAAFISAVEELIVSVGIDPQIPELQLKDFVSIRRAAFKEANATYAVPAYMSAEEGHEILAALAKKRTVKAA
jgi:alcohol dehydrogenase